MGTRRSHTTTGFSKADLHIHTTYSDGNIEPEALLENCSAAPNLRVVAITDHDTIDGALRVADHRTRHLDRYGDVDVVIGEEITTRDGHVVGLFLEHWIPPELSAHETIERIHAQGGLAVAAHPYTHLLTFTGLRGVGDLIRELPFDAIETRNSNPTELWANLWATWRSRGLAQVGGSDAHFPSAVGRCYTLFPGVTAVDLRSAILARETRAGGWCYGPLTLGRYMAAQRRRHRPIFPDRSQSHHRPLEGELQIDSRADYDHDTLHMKLEGILDARTSEATKERVAAIADSGLHLVLDLGGLIGLDSAGITVLIAGYRSAARRGTAFLITNPSPAVEEALRTAHLNRVLSVVRSDMEVRHRIQAYRETAEVLRTASRQDRMAA